MNEREILANLLRGAEREQTNFKNNCEEIADVIRTLTDSFKSKGFDDEQAMFLSIKIFEIMMQMAGLGAK